jgi:dihydrofolate synthase/folylpolyglutamate synthase
MVEERIRVDGRPIDSADFDRHVEAIQSAASDGDLLEPTFYEVTFIAAMLHFAEAGIERAIIETGLGGRGDATCLVDADLCIITTISLDHTEVLGETLPEIAREKAGIYRPGVPLIALESDDPEVSAVISEIAGDDFYMHQKDPSESPWETWRELSIMVSLLMSWGPNQAECKWPGRSPRWKPTNMQYDVKFSAAHNNEGFDAELSRIEEPCVLLIGMSQKDDILQTTSSLASELYHSPTFRHIVVSKPTSGRLPAIEPADLADTICSNRLDPPLLIDDPIRAFEWAQIMARQAGVQLVVMGSIYLIGDILKHWCENNELDLRDELSVH